MNDTHSSPAASTDEGTGTGTPTAILTRVVGLVLRPTIAARWVDRQLRRLARMGRVVIVSLAQSVRRRWVSVVAVTSLVAATSLVGLGFVAPGAAMSIIRVADEAKADAFALVAVVLFWGLLVALVRLIVRHGPTLGSRLAYSVRVACARARAEVASIGQPRPARRVSIPPVTPSIAPRPNPAATFDAQVFHNGCIAQGSGQLDAIIAVSAARDAGTATADRRRAEIILLDCSGSMGRPWSKLRAARRASAAAVDALPDGAPFAIVRGTHRAEAIFPRSGGLVEATQETRRAAKRALRLVWPEGGTALGTWLLEARELFDTQSGTVGHAILITDGRDESEAPDELRSAIEGCRGRFQCDCLGVGTAWDLDELDAIGSALLGSVDLVPSPEELSARLREVTEAAASRLTDSVELAVWVPTGARIRFLREVAPTMGDLAERPASFGARTARYRTGAWGSETRHYHLCVDLAPNVAGTEMLAARVTVMVDDRPVAALRVEATWSDDDALIARVDPAVAHYVAQEALVEAVRAGLFAHAAGDDVTAAAELGRAMQAATSTGHKPTQDLLATVLDVDDADRGTVRLRRNIDRASELALATRSRRTRVLASDPPPDQSSDRPPDRPTDRPTDRPSG